MASVHLGGLVGGMARKSLEARPFRISTPRAFPKISGMVAPVMLTAGQRGGYRIYRFVWADYLALRAGRLRESDLVPSACSATLDGMKPRARRVTIAAAVLVVGVVGVLGVLNRSTVFHHVEAWRFQLGKELRTIPPETGSKGSPGVPPNRRAFDRGFGVRCEAILRFLADYSGIPVITEAQLPEDYEWYRSLAKCRSLTGEGAVQDLRESGYRVLEQRFPRWAYVVIPPKP